MAGSRTYILDKTVCNPHRRLYLFNLRLSAAEIIININPQPNNYLFRRLKSVRVRYAASTLNCLPALTMHILDCMHDLATCMDQGDQDACTPLHQHDLS